MTRAKYLKIFWSISILILVIGIISVIIGHDTAIGNYLLIGFWVGLLILSIPIAFLIGWIAIFSWAMPLMRYFLK
jgi:hypothetical protein